MDHTSTCCIIDNNIATTSSSDTSDGLLLQSNDNNCHKSLSNNGVTVENTTADVALNNNCQSINSNVTTIVDDKNNQNIMQLVINPSIKLESSVANNSDCNNYHNLYSINSNNDNIAPTNSNDATVNLTSVNNTSIMHSHQVSERSKILDSTTTLNEQHKFVKFSLPSNSINLIQSSTPFINKSKHLFNLITEKSTNIMEKTLLPQYLIARNDFNDKKRLEYTPAVKIPSNILKNTIHDKVQDLNTINTGVIINTGEINNVINNELHDDVKNVSISQSIDVNNELLLSNTEIGNNIQYNMYSENTCDENKIFSQLVDEDKAKLVADETDLIRNNLNEIPSMDYTELLDEYKRIKGEKNILELRCKDLEAKKNVLNDNCNDSTGNSIDNRDKTIERLTNELRVALSRQDEMQRIMTIANKEKESMVMKYAVSEKQLIDTQKSKCAAEKKIKDIMRDYELLECKWKHAHSERVKISNILDTKCRELVDGQKEVEKLREDIDVREVKLKWTQTKLKNEIEIHKETHEKLDKVTSQINQMKEELEKVRRASQDTIKKFQQSEENKAVTLDQQLKEQQAQLILERHVTEDKEILRLQLVREVEMLNNRQHILMEENSALSLKIDELEKSKFNYENNLSNLKTIADRRHREILELTDKLCHLETLKLELINKEQCLAANQQELERLKLVNKELQVDMDCCLQRETNMLEFTQKLTDKNVKLQSEFTSIEARANKLQVEQGPLHETIVQLKAKVKMLQDNLTLEKTKRIEECELLAKHVAEQTQLAKNLSQMLEDSRGENTVLKRKHQVSIKELTRELLQLRKKLEVYEAKSLNSTRNDISRTGSSTSLNADNVTQNGSSLDTTETNEIQSYNNLDKTALIERIIKMQRINVKRAEKLDFLEEHTRALVAELQKKAKIIQNYILTESFDAMGSNERDRYKAELIKHGGIMASVYHQRVSDDNMTLELSLEINQKLQTVLEDALLKNITLKDNIDTLGEEIARLTIQNQQKTSK